MAACRGIPAGIYPVIRDIDSGIIFWEMEGYESTTRAARTERLEEGSSLLALWPAHDEITSTSPTKIQSLGFSESQFKAFISRDPVCVEGPSKRLEFSLSISL